MGVSIEDSRQGSFLFPDPKNAESLQRCSYKSELSRYRKTLVCAFPEGLGKVTLSRVEFVCPRRCRRLSRQVKI